MGIIKSFKRVVIFTLALVLCCLFTESLAYGYSQNQSYDEPAIEFLDSAPDAKIVGNRLITPYFEVTLPEFWLQNSNIEVQAEGEVAPQSFRNYFIVGKESDFRLIQFAVSPASDPFHFRGTSRRWITGDENYNGFIISAFWTPFNHWPPSSSEGKEKQAVRHAKAFYLDSGGSINLTPETLLSYSHVSYMNLVDVCSDWLATNVTNTIKAVNGNDDSSISHGIFADVFSNAWYADVVNEAVEHGIMKGWTNAQGQTVFGANDSMNRAEAATVLWRFAESAAAQNYNASSAKNTTPWSDAPSGQYYTAAMNWAYENNIFSGYGNGKVGPNDPLSREQLCSILYNLATSKYGVSKAGNSASSYADATNQQSVASWAQDAVGWAYHNNIMTGYAPNNDLAANATVNRAQAAKMFVYTLGDLIGWDK